MMTYETILLILLVLDALALGGFVLLQQGRGADVGAAFVAGTANTMFGSAGSTSFLTKVTVWLAIGFFLISFGLAYFAKERAESLQDLGVPAVVEPVTAPEELTTEEEGVDSGLPDV